MNDTEPDPLGIPPSLIRDANNKAEFMMADSSVSEIAETESKPVKAKAAVKATGKVKAKGAGKAPIKAKTAPKAAVKAAKATKTAKPAKAKHETAEKDVWGFRKGSAKSKAVEMYSRKNGATLEEVKAKVGSIQLNVLNSLEAEGKTVERVKETRKGQRPVTRYILKA